MKKLITVALFALASAAGMAQDVDNFEVGPYEVEYKGPGDFKSRLRKDVDLYRYYNLKRDTVINASMQSTEPVRGAFQLNVSMSLPRYVTNGTSNVFGIDGGWKQVIGKNVYFNAGLLLALSFGSYGGYWQSIYGSEWNSNKGALKETMFEVGIPLSIEFGKVDYKKPTMFASIGVTPTLYVGAKGLKSKTKETASGSTATAKADGDFIGMENETKSGLYVAPKLEVGGYLPTGGPLVRMAGFMQYNVNCSKGDFDVFKKRIGRLFLGASVGLVF